MTDKFAGFEIPKTNFSRLPHGFVEDVLPVVDTLAELKCVIYVLRHTWGFAEYGKPKKITLDEFRNGRKRRDGSRIDKGTGLSIPSIRTGLEHAVDHGFLIHVMDDSDKARVKNYYSLNMKEAPAEERDDDAEYAEPEEEGQSVKDLHSAANDLQSGSKGLALVQRKKLLKEKNIKLSVANQIFLGVQNIQPDETALLQQAVIDNFGINVRWGSSAATKTSMSPADFEAWMFTEKITVEQVARAAKVWKQSKKFNWRTPTLILIWENWNLLMSEALPDDEQQQPNWFVPPS